MPMSGYLIFALTASTGRTSSAHSDVTGSAPGAQRLA